jgi:hypothetical protein
MVQKAAQTLLCPGGDIDSMIPAFFLLPSRRIPIINKKTGNKGADSELVISRSEPRNFLKVFTPDILDARNPVPNS